MIAGDSLADAPVPREGQITWRFQLVLLMRHAEREAARRNPPQEVECEIDLSTPAPRVSEELLARLPVGESRALLCQQMHARMPGWTRDQVARRLSELARSGRCQRVGSLGQSRYYRES